MAARKRIDWHKLLQDILDNHLEMMSGKQVLEADREMSAHFRIDYFCRCGSGPPAGRAATIGGIRPFDHLKTCNVIEYKSIHQTLNERTFRAYVAKTLLMETRIGSQDETTLTILLTRLPRALLKSRYGFEQLTPWKYRSRFLPSLDIYLLIQRETRGIKGGEPLAFLQVLEGDSRYQGMVWQAVMAQDIEDDHDLKKVIMTIDREGYMTMLEKITKEAVETAVEAAVEAAVKEGEIKTLRRILSSILEARPKFQARYGSALAAATTVEEIRKLETAIMRDLANG